MPDLSLQGIDVNVARHLLLTHALSMKINPFENIRMPY